MATLPLKTGRRKTAAERGKHAQDNVLEGRLQVPTYFTQGFTQGVQKPRIVDGYKAGQEGQFCQAAAKMLRMSSNMGSRCCCDVENEFDVVRSFRQIENDSLWRRHRAYEFEVERRLEGSAREHVYNSNGWLRRLAARNGLSEAANTCYLLHGTSVANLRTIAEQGLRKELAGRRFASIYGRGLYFTDSACLAHQLSDRGRYASTDSSKASRGTLLLCRVVLGRVAVLRCESTNEHAPAGFESAMAKDGITTRRPFVLNGTTATLQVHNEFVVYDDAAVYPEFVIEFGDFAFSV